jgi:hypothetical protein
VTSQDLKPENYEQQDVRPAHQTEMDSQMADHPILIAKLGKNQELACRCVAKKVIFPLCYSNLCFSLLLLCILRKLFKGD